MPKTFLAVNFGCRVNSAETNQWSQILIDQGYTPLVKSIDPPQRGEGQGRLNIILINTCSITKKGEIESLSKVRILSKKYPKAKIYVTGCANLEKIKNIKNVYIFDNKAKEKILEETNCLYTSDIKDKFSHTHRYILKVQSGCNQFCSYCTVPNKRPDLWSLSIENAINTVDSVTEKGYKEVIITGVNLNQYQYGFSNLIEAIIQKTNIPLISFGSIPLNCIDEKFLQLLSTFNLRISNFIHIPLQSGSDRILKLMHRPYTKKDIIKTFNKLKKVSLSSKVNRSSEVGRETPAIARERDFEFGTDVIVGFPGETDSDFQETLELCKKIGFQKIHCFKYSSRPNTLAKIYYESNHKIKKEELSNRSQQIRSLIK